MRDRGSKVNVNETDSILVAGGCTWSIHCVHDTPERKSTKCQLEVLTRELVKRLERGRSGQKPKVRDRTRTKRAGSVMSETGYNLRKILLSIKCELGVGQRQSSPRSEERKGVEISARPEKMNEVY